MNNTKMNSQSIALLSGKGGSGKTIISLSICKMLSQAGFKTLLVDLDLATHGATYFFENEFRLKNQNVISIADILYDTSFKGSPLLTPSGFYFIPSILRPADTSVGESSPADSTRLDSMNSFFDGYFSDYQAVVFDCQAGFSPLTKWALHFTDRNLFVLEADPVSSAAVRVLYLQVASALRRSNSWQVFNKLTEEERPIYEKVSVGTFFTNLPPIPFDWGVKAAFALGEIPQITSKGSAFGLGVLRLMKILFPEFGDKLSEVENSTVGAWYSEIAENLVQLENTKREILYTKIERERRRRYMRTQLFTSLVFVAATSAFVFQFFFPSSAAIQYTVYVLLGTAALASLSWQVLTQRELRSEREQDSAQESLAKIEKEIEKFRTLFITDPRLREYSKTIDDPRIREYLTM